MAAAVMTDYPVFSALSSTMPSSFGGFGGRHGGAQDPSANRCGVAAAAGLRITAPAASGAPSWFGARVPAHADQHRAFSTPNYYSVGTQFDDGESDDQLVLPVLPVFPSEVASSRSPAVAAATRAMPVAATMAAPVSDEIQVPVTPRRARVRAQHPQGRHFRLLPAQLQQLAATPAPAQKRRRSVDECDADASSDEEGTASDCGSDVSDTSSLSVETGTCILAAAPLAPNTVSAVGRASALRSGKRQCRSIRFSEAAKTNDGVAPVNAAFDRLVCMHFSQTSAAKNIASKLAIVQPHFLHFMIGMTDRLIERVLASTSGAAPILPGGGGSAAKVAISQVPHLLELQRILVTAYLAPAAGGASVSASAAQQVALPIDA